MNEALFARRVSLARLPLRASDGRLLGMLLLRPLPTRSAPLAEADETDGAELEPVRVLEGGEYGYRIEDEAASGAWRVDPETMSPDDTSGQTGRFKPQLRVGSLRLDIALDGEPVQVPAIEVVARKLDYLTDYRRMLESIAALGAGLVLERFAANQQDLQPDFGAEGTPYQRFRFLDALLREGGVREALQLVLASPAVAFEEEEERRTATRGVRASVGAVRDLTRPGPRVPWGGHPILGSVPRELTHRRTEPTSDTVPNRFVRFALEGWIALLDDLDAGLAADALQGETGPMARGRAEIAAMRAELEEALRHEVLRDAARLSTFPVANPTLMRRAGYREIFRAWMLTEAGARLAWSGGEDVFGAGQKNVAALYEYWVFLELARILGQVCRPGERLHTEDLVVPGRGGFTLDLQRGREARCVGRFRRLGREIEVRFSFNRSFSRDGERESWSLPLRPDCTLEVEVLGSAPDLPLLRLHFDAKYKLDSVEDLLNFTGDPETEALAPKRHPRGHGGARPGDLLKMHAYRDAIFNAAGAYVVFPGVAPERIVHFPKWDERLPGLGALPMRPDADGRAQGAAAITAFLSELLDHVASQGSQHERLRFWEDRARREKGVPGVLAMPGLRAPPADTRALFGFVRSEAQLAWVRERQLYNIRADGRSGTVLPEEAGPLQADLLVLWGTGLDPGVEVRRMVGPPRVWTADMLQASGYPKPRGELYLVFPVGERLEAPPWLVRAAVDRLARAARAGAVGTPFVARWSTVAAARSPA